MEKNKVTSKEGLTISESTLIRSVIDIILSNPPAALNVVGAINFRDDELFDPIDGVLDLVRRRAYETRTPEYFAKLVAGKILEISEPEYLAICKNAYKAHTGVKL